MATLLLAALVPALAAATREDELARAETLLAQRKFAAAETLLRALVEADPTNARAHGNLALALLPQGKVREAVDEGRLAAAMGPDLPEARYIYALALKAAGRPLEAARELEKAVALKPAEAGPLRALAATYAASDDERTEATYAKLIGTQPADTAARGELAEYFWRVGREASGNRVMEEAVRAFPDDVSLRLRYGRALAQQSLFVDAAAQLERARMLGAAEAYTLSLLAAAYSQAGDLESARRVLKGAVEAHPANASLRSDLCRLFLSEGMAAEALPQAEEAVRLEPRSAETWLQAGRAEEMLGRLDAAERSYREAVRLAPSLPGAHYSLGRLLITAGRKAQGEAELALHHGLYEKGLERVSAADASAAEFALAWATLNRGQAAEALRRFESLPDTADSLRGRAKALSRLQRHAEAVRVLERARQLAPDDPRIEMLLATERSRSRDER